MMLNLIVAECYILRSNRSGSRNVIVPCLWREILKTSIGRIVFTRGILLLAVLLYNAFLEDCADERSMRNNIVPVHGLLSRGSSCEAGE